MIFIIAALTAYSVTFFLMQKATWLHKRHALLDALLDCTYCTGFWCSLISLFLFKDAILLGDSTPLPNILGFALAGAIVCYMLDIIMGILEIKLGGDNE